MVYMNNKMCFKCGIEKELDNFYKHPAMVDGRVNKCKECNKLDVRSNYANKKEQYQLYDRKRQRENKTRIFNHRYTQIKQRVEGRAIRDYRVKGKALLSYDEYCRWLVANMETFDLLYTSWKESGFERSLTPSIDRINNNKGYEADNMQWVTVSYNAVKRAKEPF